MARLYITNITQLSRLGKDGLIVFAGKKLNFGPIAKKMDEETKGLLTNACKVAGFNGEFESTVDILSPSGTDFQRIIIVGVGDKNLEDDETWTKLGGIIMGAISKYSGKYVSILPEPINRVKLTPNRIANLGLGIQLRQYKFDEHKTKQSRRNKDNSSNLRRLEIRICLENPNSARKAYSILSEVGKGVTLARDLVNQPANILGTEEFVAIAQELYQIGVQVEVFEEDAMQEMRMNALLGVAKGSPRPPKLLVMRWSGGKPTQRPIAIVGKGVVFDSGGISIKPGRGMEDMKGDMGGAAAVLGAMRALAGRKSRLNVIGVIGLVENMPDGNAQRPGDVVTSMSGQTIEVLNTDAEGRLVLADALWYTQLQFNPRCTIDLATLTGAIIVALGQHYAGMFCNDDATARAMSKAGEEVGEKVWRMPLAEEYDKLIDGTVGDVKNIGGKTAGAVTAAQFLQRFVNNKPWVHLDIAGTAMDSPKTSINQSWASGFGVRLLDRFIKNKFEK